MNSYRDKVKDVIFNVLDASNIPERKADVLKYEIADAVFDALGITEDEQNKAGGYFMLYAENGGKQFIETVAEEEDEVDGMEYEPEVVAEKRLRLQQLEEGAKYTLTEFKEFSKAKNIKETGGLYITLQTPICKYGQAYDRGVMLLDAKLSFATNYYPMYLEDYERSNEVDKMDKE
jgi:hypothetical protein